MQAHERRLSASKGKHQRLPITDTSQPRGSDGPTLWVFFSSFPFGLVTQIYAKRKPGTTGPSCPPREDHPGLNLPAAIYCMPSEVGRFVGDR